jgi:hypothetical protein
MHSGRNIVIVCYHYFIRYVAVKESTGVPVDVENEI